MKILFLWWLETMGGECAICGGTAGSPFLTCRDQTATGETFVIVRCDGCGLKYTHAAPAEHEIGRYYCSQDYVSHTDTARGFIHRLYHVVRGLTLAQKAKYVEKAARLKAGALLDYGCGTGAFLATMRRRGWNVSGLEPDAGARAIAQSKHSLEVREPDALFEFAPDTFDVVTLWHVLEHVHRLHPTLARIVYVTKTGGSVFVAVPNAEAKDAEIYRGHWAAYDVPRHLYHFRVEDVERLARRHGLSVVEKKLMPFDAFYVSMLSEKYTRGFMPRALWNGLRSNLAAYRDVRRSSSILYHLKKNRENAS